MDDFTHHKLLPRAGAPGWNVEVLRSIDPETLELVMQRVPVKSVIHILPEAFLLPMENNQLLRSCCRHPENHSIEGWKSHPREPAPDIYIFYCDCCNREQRIFCVGETDLRPIWNRTLKG